MKQYTYCDLTEDELVEVFCLLERTPEFADEVSPDTFNSLLRTGHMQLWVEPDLLDPVLLMVTELHARAGYAKILAFAGTNVDMQRAMFASIKKWAKRNGCNKLRAECLDPQTRLFARDGFKKIRNVIELDLGDDHAS